MTGPTAPAGRALLALGARLRALREELGLPGTEFAARLGEGWRQSKISKIETGRQLPTAAELAAWAEATGVAADGLMALREKASAEYSSYKERIARAGDALSRQDEISALLYSSTFLAEFQAVVVPGRLQTPSYMRGLAQGNEYVADNGLPSDVLDRVIAAKVRWQSILYEPGREIVHVLSESVLRTRYGNTSHATMRSQLAHLAELATLPRHTFGVIPFSVPCPVPAGGFQLYDRDLVVVESIAGDVQLADPDVVARYSRWFDQLLDAALTGPDAAAFCREVAADLP